MMATSLRAGIVVVMASCAAAWAQPVMSSERFDRDPGWEGRNNVPPREVGEVKTQAFRHSPTNHAGGKPGELGGWMYRSLTPCYLARPIAPKTLGASLKVSGRFAVTASQGSSGVLIGWFNSQSRGWRTPNSMAVRIDGEDGKFRIFFEYGTQHGKTGGGATFEGEYQTTKTPMHQADGTVHTFDFVYDPAGGNGCGDLALVLDGQEYRAAMRDGHTADGAAFDRFGVFNQQISGNGMEVWFDDLTVNGETFAFDEDPKWEGLNNERTFTDRAVRPYHDFGFRDSNFAGGQPGEIGGLVWRIESVRSQEALAYGTPVSGLSLNDPLEASGKVCLRLGSADSAVLIGWYNSRTAIGAPPLNFLGVLIEGPSAVGHYFRPILGASDGTNGMPSTGPLLPSDGRPHEWAVRYDPNGSAGRGRIEAQLDGENVPLDLPEGARKADAAFDRFGILSWQRGGHCVEVCFDDLTFTSGKK